MAKIWRRKKGKKYIGSYIVLVRGKRVNLKTDDAELARDRAKAALAGKWPEKKKTARDPVEEEAAAKVAAASLHVEAAPEPVEDSPEDGPRIWRRRFRAFAPESVADSPEDGPAGKPAPQSTSAAEPVGSPMDEAAAVAAAAAAGAGEEPPPDAIDAEEAAKRAEWRAKMEAIFGGGMGGGSIGGGIAAGTIFANGLLFGYLGKKSKPRRYLVFDPQKTEFLIQGLGCAWDEQLRRWGVGLGEMEPWKAILACTIGISGAMAFSLTKERPDDWPEDDKEEAEDSEIPSGPQIVK